MSWTLIACLLIAFAWMGLFYLWGRSFLMLIRADIEIASSICFGYLVLQILYQIIYLPFFFLRGSYRTVSYIWLGIVVIVSIFLIAILPKHPANRKAESKKTEKMGLVGAVVIVLSLAIYIALHVPFYGSDTVTYISAMNESYYKDAMWISTKSSFHYGMSSMYQFFTLPSLLTGIKPYYISLFTVRIVGICLFSLIVYRIGCIISKKEGNAFCWPAVILSVFVPLLLMFWGSNYTAEFFYWRIYEAKGLCQFVLLPIGFSVFLDMLRKGTDRKALWKEQLIICFAAVPVSASSLTPYFFLLLIGVFALLANDRFKNSLKSLSYTLLCALPNIVYLVIYILETKGLIAL